MGQYQSTPTTTQNSGMKKIPHFYVGYSTMQGWRKTMEDAHVISQLDEDKAILGVYDGHQGCQVSQFCANTIASTITSSSHYPLSYEDALTDAYLTIDKTMRTPEGSKLLAEIAKTEDYDNQMLVNGYCDITKDIGSTALTCVIDENLISVANVGDSRAVLVRGDEIIQLTTDHKPNVRSEAERIQRCGGVIRNNRVNGNLSLTRALGDTQFKKGTDVEKYIISPVPEITNVDLDGTEDIIVLGCDGIWDVMSNEEVIKEVKDRLENGMKLNMICEELLMKCLSDNPYEHPGSDNMTLIIAIVDKPEHKWRRCFPGGDQIS